MLIARKSLPTPYAVPAPQVEQLLFVGRGLNMAITTDQALTKVFQGTNYIPTRVFGVRKTGGVTVACAGGIYTAASKAGTAMVAAAQVWTAVTGTLGFIAATIAALAVGLSANPLYFALTTGSTGACTADIFVFGVVID
jgi:hypothetical protein